MDKIIGTLGIVLIIMLPLIRFYQRSNWSKAQILISIAGIFILWFLIATPLHELSHMIGIKISGAEISDYQLVPMCWKGDFRHAFVNPDFDTKLQEFSIRTAPYFRDLIIAVLGYFILFKQKIESSFLVGLIFTFFLLNSVYDIVVNFLGYSIDQDGDLNGLSILIGHFWTYLISLCVIIVTSILAYRIFKIYKGFPKRIAHG